MVAQSDPSPLVLFEMIEPHVALVTLNRPEKRNAVNGELAAALERLVRMTEDEPQVRAVILTSSHDTVFCAGADLAAVAGGGSLSIETAQGGFAGLVFANRTKPWIVAVEGAALAGGFEICLACDMIVASHRASFGLPEVKRGLMAGAGGVHRLPNRIAPSIAYEMIATGDAIGADRAHACGLVNRLVEPGGALAAAREIARRIVPNAPLAVQHSLSVARFGVGQSDGAARALASEHMAMLRKTEDFKEGPRAFVEKREAVWKGR
jgi:enoyl-CoA hydratase/carnithine racemase